MKQLLEFKFAGKRYSVRPEWEVLVGIEAVTNQGSFALGQKILARQGSITELAAVMSVLLQGKEGAPPPDQIGPILVEDGYDDLLAPVGLFLCYALRGNKEHEKRQNEEAAKAKAGKKEPDPPKAQPPKA